MGLSLALALSLERWREVFRFSSLHALMYSSLSRNALRLHAQSSAFGGVSWTGPLVPSHPKQPGNRAGLTISTMQNLPTEIVHDILSSCPSGRALLSLSSTCHRFRSIYLQDCSELLYASIINDSDLELPLHLVGTIQICASNPKLVELRKLHRPRLVLNPSGVKYYVQVN